MNSRCVSLSFSVIVAIAPSLDLWCSRDAPGTNDYAGLEKFDPQVAPKRNRRDEQQYQTGLIIDCCVLVCVYVSVWYLAFTLHCLVLSILCHGCVGVSVCVCVDVTVYVLRACGVVMVRIDV
jgi:hypothetical protein